MMVDSQQIIINVAFPHYIYISYIYTSTLHTTSYINITLHIFVITYTLYSQHYIYTTSYINITLYIFIILYIHVNITYIQHLTSTSPYTSSSLHTHLIHTRQHYIYTRQHYIYTLSRYIYTLSHYHYYVHHNYSDQYIYDTHKTH